MTHYKKTGFTNLIWDDEGVQGMILCPHCNMWVRIETKETLKCEHMHKDDPENAVCEDCYEEKK